MNQAKLWTKDFIGVTFANFSIGLNYYLLMVIITLYAMDTFGSSPSLAGLAASIFIIGTLLARFFAGSWVERVGRKRMLVTGTILCFAMTLLYFPVNNIWLLFVIRFIHGAGYGIASTAAGTIAADLVPRERRGEGIGYYMLSMTLAAAVGPFIAMFISQYGNFRLIFIFCTISAVLSVGSAFVLSVPEIKLTKEQIEELRGFKLNSFFEAKALPISIVCAIIYFCYSSLLSFLTSYAKEIHLVDTASFFFVVYAIAILVSRPFTGRLFDSKGENITMYPAFIIFSLGMILLSQTHQGFTLLLAGAFLGFGVGVVQSCGQAIAVKVTPKHRLGLANSTFFILADLGIGIGPFVLGLFVPFTGYRGVYMGLAVVALTCVFIYYLVHGRKSSESKTVSDGKQ